MNNFLKSLVASVEAVLGFEAMTGWLTSAFTWLYLVLHNWNVLAQNGWLVAGLFVWAILNVMWAALGGLALLFGLMDDCTDHQLALIVCGLGIVQAVAVFMFLIYQFGW